MNCPKCGNEIDPGAAFCGNCGQQLIVQSTVPVSGPASSLGQAVAAPALQAMPPQPIAPLPPTPQPVPQPVPVVTPASVRSQPVVSPFVQPAPVQQAASMPAYAVPREKSNAKTIVGFVLGILSIFASIIPILGLGLGITALVLGAMSLNTKKGLAIASMVLGVIAIVLSVLIAIGSVMVAKEEAAMSNFLYLPF